ncbi:DUF3037 domain-containing protein [Frankia canadensis]|uniref:DUF3037 domain-containing protein n=1 Tax=Frankia canadensis TaxID=1836972 RepID=UPI001FAE9652|nr:DUF3037 domain-containing protein [Frankia canadensis]
MYPHHDWASADAAAGPAGRLAPGERFRWLTAPRSTVVQTSPVHTAAKAARCATTASASR